MDAIVDPSADVVGSLFRPSSRQRELKRRCPRRRGMGRGPSRCAPSVEGTNLLMMPGRHVARPHEKSETPGVELEPEEIEANINKDRAQWNKLAKGLYDTSMEALKAIDAKDVNALIDIGGRMDMSCENCHMAYWYPNQPLPPSDDPRFKTLTPNK